ncbi:BMC domain-containing protein [Sporolituus thermophilus]|uniref:BMC domain-containing protein n=1 Tax=Sporolituus thermophilus DSM 23256 TaxID=1123285 RepID=A0A1G7M5H0_9FIRM|nr:BMC domain-containing protein [Sporolituus thermophilus]SDF56460.1 BMC domain-containing protein [Sporolituus thermophilus DSM 23256]
MANNALGMIETVGLAAAIEAADAAVKAASVTLLGYELTRGGGLVLVKLIGDVGAVKAAVAAGAQSAQKVNKVWSTHVIARPHREVAPIIQSRETVGCQAAAHPAALGESGLMPEKTGGEDYQEEYELAELDKPDDGNDQQEEIVPTKRGGELCNLCGDPACGRKKGEPKSTCINYKKGYKEDE